MLRKSPAADAQVEIFKNADFSKIPLKVKKLSKFWLFSYLKFLCFSIINKIAFIVSVKPN